MGLEAGFDMVPRLSKGAVDGQNWQSFIKRIKDHYQDDDRIEVKLNYIVFKAGEHPRLPLEGHKFLRFSSKISGNHAEGVGGYIDIVTLLAKSIFGSRVKSWNEAFEQYGSYGWQEVNDSFTSYEQTDEPVIPTKIAQYVSGVDPIRELDMPLFDVRSVPGKGHGVVARFNIAKGSRIICEKPLFTNTNPSSMSVMEGNIAAELKTLSKDQQRQFLSLHNNFPGKYPFSGIVKTNALPCGPESVVAGIYPKICRINHSCLPNAHNNWNSETKCETIHTIRDIRSGEEITIAYDKGGSRETRRSHLREAFGFECNCDLCSLPPSDCQASDTRRLQIQDLDHAVGDPLRVMSKPDDCLADCHLLLQVLKEEFKDGAGALLARLYYDAFQISIIHGDQARASVFAERGYQSRLVCEGEDSPETKTIKKLMENPKSHRSFGTSKKWKTAKGLVPNGLDANEFDKWLWRQRREQIVKEQSAD